MIADLEPKVSNAVSRNVPLSDAKPVIELGLSWAGLRRRTFPSSKFSKNSSETGDKEDASGDGDCTTAVTTG